MKEGFLAAQWVQETVTAAVEAVPAVAEVKDAEGNVTTPAVAAVPAVEAVYADVLHRAYIEYDMDKIVQTIAADAGNIYYYRIVASEEGRSISIEPVVLKAGARETVAKEVVEIEAGGESLGSAEV